MERKFSAAPPAMVEAANRVGLPLITLPFDTPFVHVTQAVHTLILSQHAQVEAQRHQLAEQELLADLATGRLTDIAGLKARLKALEYRLPDPPWLAFVTVGSEAPLDALRSGAIAELGPRSWLAAPVGDELHLVAFSSDRQRLAAALRGLARRLGAAPAGAGRCVSSPAALPASLAEARQTMSLRRANPGLAPLFEETGVYQLALGRSREELQEYVSAWLGPLLQFDRTHKSNLCQTLRLLLDSRLAMSEAAQQLHLTRQGLYHRMERIAEVLGRNLEDAEVRLALAMALRFQDVLTAAARP